IVLLAALELNLLTVWLATPRLSGGLIPLAGVLTAIRLLRWPAWLCADRPDLLVLLVGYAWLALGLILTGLAVAGLWPVSAVLHSITVGALGSLTFGVMARTRLSHRFRDPNARRWIHPLVLLLSL